MRIKLFYCAGVTCKYSCYQYIHGCSIHDFSSNDFPPFQRLRSAMDTKALVLVKLGGSAITDKSRERTVQKNILQQLARELKTSKTPLLISHGAGSFAHRSAQKY